MGWYWGGLPSENTLRVIPGVHFPEALNLVNSHGVTPFCKWGAIRRKDVVGLTQVTLGVWDKALGKHNSQKYPSTVPGFGTIVTKLLKKWWWGGGILRKEYQGRRAGGS